MKQLGNFVLFAITLSACGDVIKAPNPFKKGRYTPPAEYRDEVLRITCPNFEGRYEGSCQRGSSEPEARSFLFSQNFCTSFGIANGNGFRTNSEEIRTGRGGLQVTSIATWSHANQTLNLSASWFEEAVGYRRTHVLDSLSKTVEERLVQLGSDSSETLIESCRYSK